jgi:simple sugar transport system substrate-binding protein
MLGQGGRFVNGGPGDEPGNSGRPRNLKNVDTGKEPLYVFFKYFLEDWFMKRKALLFFLFVGIVCALFAAGGKQGSGKGGQLEIAVIVKLEHPWFDDMKIGIDQAAKELGVNAYMIAPAEADAAQQVALIETAIARGVDAICVVPNDPAAIEPVLKKAQNAGIITITHEAPTAQNVSFDIEAFDNAVMGRRFIDNVVKYGSDSGSYAFFVGNLTAETHMERFNAALKHQQEKYPNLKLLTNPPLVSNENTQVAYEKTLELLQTYGNNLTAIVTSAAGSPPGVGRALEEKGLGNKIVSIGSSVPSIIKPLVDKGYPTVISLWRPADAGYVQVWLAKELLEGRTITDGQVIPRFGKVTVKGKLIVGGEDGCKDWGTNNTGDFFF